MNSSKRATGKANNRTAPWIWIIWFEYQNLGVDNLPETNMAQPKTVEGYRMGSLAIALLLWNDSPYKGYIFRNPPITQDISPSFGLKGIPLNATPPRNEALISLIMPY